MILRRIADAIRRQDWFVVVLEVFIVVVGIFIGLQVDDWNEARKDRALEQQYLSRLHEDAITAVKRQRSSRAWNDERVRTQEIVLKALRSGSLADGDRAAFSLALTHAGSYNPLIWQWGTVEELYSTGNIRVIRDIELRDLLSAAEIEFSRRQEIITEAKAQIRNLRSQISRRFDPVTYGFGTVDPATVTFDFAALASDSEFVATFSNLHLESLRLLSFTQGHLEYLEAFEAAIARARGLVPLGAEE